MLKTVIFKVVLAGLPGGRGGAFGALPQAGSSGARAALAAIYSGSSACWVGSGASTATARPAEIVAAKSPEIVDQWAARDPAGRSSTAQHAMLDIRCTIELMRS